MLLVINLREASESKLHRVSPNLDSVLYCSCHIHRPKCILSATTGLVIILLF